MDEPDFRSGGTWWVKVALKGLEVHTTHLPFPICPFVNFHQLRGLNLPRTGEQVYLSYRHHSRDTFMNTKHPDRIHDSSAVLVLPVHIPSSGQAHRELNPLRNASVHTTILCGQHVSHVSTHLLPGILPLGTVARYVLYLSSLSAMAKIDDWIVDFGYRVCPAAMAFEQR